MAELDLKVYLLIPACVHCHVKLSVTMSDAFPYVSFDGTERRIQKPKPRVSWVGYGTERKDAERKGSPHQKPSFGHSAIFLRASPPASRMVCPEYPLCNQVVSSLQNAHLFCVILMTTCF